MTRQNFAFPTAGDAAGYLSAALETEDPRSFVDALETVVRSRGVETVARSAGLSAVDLNQRLSLAAISGAPQLDLMIRTLAAVGLRFVVSPQGE